MTGFASLFTIPPSKIECAFLKAKEQGPGPASAGDQSSNLGETVIAGAVVLVSALGDMNDIGSGLPLADEPGSGFDRQRLLDSREPGPA